MKPTPPVLGSAARPFPPHVAKEPCSGRCGHGYRSTSGLVPDLPSVYYAPSFEEAVPAEREFTKASRQAVMDLAEIVCRGHLYPLCDDRPVHIEWALIHAFADHGMRLFPTPAPPARRPLARAERDAVFDRDGRRCRWCGATEGLVIDHVHPVRWGGGNEPSNLQVLCRGCNSWKSDRVAVDA